MAVHCIPARVSCAERVFALVGGESRLSCSEYMVHWCPVGLVQDETEGEDGVNCAYIIDDFMIGFLSFVERSTRKYFSRRTTYAKASENSAMQGECRVVGAALPTNSRQKRRTSTFWD